MTLADTSTPAVNPVGLGRALLLANVRYWPTVAPLVGRELRRWAARAESIPDGELKALAFSKLVDEHFNAQVAATLATLAPPPRRAAVVEAIVAHQVLYDYLDGLTEQVVPEHLQSNLSLYQALTDSVSLVSDSATDDYFRLHPKAGDGGYMQALASTVRASLARLPSATAVGPIAAAVARRCGHAQSRVHATGYGDSADLASWAAGEAKDSPLGWREWLAGAVSCVLGVHALIAAAAEDAATPRDAVTLDDAYLPISALSTMLDGLVDRRSDLAGGRTPWLLSHYEDAADILQPLAETAACATTRAAQLPRAEHHLMTISGVVAYYASSPDAGEPHARPAFERLQRELGPSLSRALAVMGAWRACKRVSLSPRLSNGSEPRLP